MDPGGQFASDTTAIVTPAPNNAHPSAGTVVRTPPPATMRELAITANRFIICLHYNLGITHYNGM